jgi:polar amino acid transport system ATP-binding protein
MTVPPRAAGTPVLSVEGVVKSFGAEQVLRGVSLTVPEHTVTVLIGASGSGKSTLLRCVNLLTRVDDGVIRLDGRTSPIPRSTLTWCAGRSAWCSSRSTCSRT